MTSHSDLDRSVGLDYKPVTLPKDHPNVFQCEHCGRWSMFRWGAHGFRVYQAIEQVRTVRSTGKRSHWGRCGKE